jgi:Fe-S cluster biogenesis protein NfuA
MCGLPPSRHDSLHSATLKMGIERQLKAVFGDAVSEVVQVSAAY